MYKPAIEKVYVILDQDKDSKKLGRLCRGLYNLFPYMNLTSNLYLVTTSLTEGIPQVERVQEDATHFLRDNLFARLYLHFVHHISQATANKISFYYQYYYQNLKLAARGFDREGYMHQEVPRLMLLPVIAPDDSAEPASFTHLMDILKGAFFLPCLYLDEDTFFLAQDEDLLTKTEKVYYGHGTSKKGTDIVCSLCYQDILDGSSARLEPGIVLTARPCAPSLIISAHDGMVYKCMDAFRKQESLGDIYGELSVHTLMDRYSECANTPRDCLWCQEQVLKSSASIALPEPTRHEIGALLYQLAMFHEDAKDHGRAIENYRESIKLSPGEEVGTICFRLGLNYTNTGCYDEAIEAFEEAEHTYGQVYYLHFYKGLCYFQKGDYHTALAKFSKAMDLTPEQEELVRILIYMGTCHNNLGQYKEAVATLDRAKKLSGHLQEIYNALGFSYFQLKDYDKAIENLSKAVEIDPHSAIDYASLGANYREKGDISQAIAMYKKALELEPSLTAATENLRKLKGNK